MASGAIEADCCCTVINVLTTVISGPTVNADTGVATDGVEACSSIVTGVGLHEALIDILSTVLPWGGYVTHCFMHNHLAVHRYFVEYSVYILRAVPVHSGGHWQL